MAFFSTVDCQEVHDEPQNESPSLDNWQTQVTLSCAWNQRYNLIADVLGNRRVWPYFSGANAPRALSATMSPRSVTGTKVPGSPQLLVYEKARVRFTYGQIQVGPTNPQPGELAYDAISETMEPTVEFMNLDHKLFKWGSATGTPLLRDESPGRQVARMKIVRTYYGLPSIPSEILTLLGKCNDSAVSSQLLGLTFPAQTLLVGSPRPTRNIKSDGTYVFTLTTSFSYKQEGWNKFYRSDTNDYESIYDKDGIVEPYPPTNITPIFS